MNVVTENYTRKPFVVQAVRVTEKNLNAVCDWAGGETKLDRSGRVFIKINVRRAWYGRQTMAFTGDWVLKAGTGFRIYTNTAFVKSFDRTNEPVSDSDITRPLFTN